MTTGESSVAAVRRPGESDRAVRVGMFAALRDQSERLLLVHRNDWDMWCLPGGLFEHGESVADGLRRECREELGVEVELGALLGVYSEPASQRFTFNAGHSVHYVTIVVSGVAPDGPLVPCADEVRAVGMFGRDELPRLVPSHRLWIEDAFRPAGAPYVR